ncbi:MAG: beta-galactosidase [Candidatus Pacebacteria bacterium]|nr:beta-galactosidase [Candidatus Paceibacterota bacterium]
MNTQTFTTLFPVGSHLCREPMPAMSEMKHDMELLKKQGFNLIKIQEHWMIDEPREGEYDFSRYEELIEYAASLDLGIYLGLTCEQAPHWLYEKHPDCRMIMRNGTPVVYESQTTLPGDGKPGPCCDHPGAMADQLRFIRKLVKTLGRFENVVVWNTWQEISYWAESLIGGHVCYCAHTLAAYRAWLRQEYGDLDSLNRAWNSRYAEWSDIVPDCGNRVTVSAQEIQWRTFMDNVQIANVLKQRAAAIRAADPLDRPVFAHKGGPALASSMDWTYARCQDFLGSSCYPAWGCGHAWDDQKTRPFDKHYALRSEMLDAVAYRYDYIRSANPGAGHAGGVPVWAAEFQGGPVSTGFHKGRVPSADDIRRWMLSAVGAGVTAISFWVTRAEIMAAEQNGFSLLDSMGDETPRLKEAGRIGRALNEHAELFAQPTQQPGEVGILVNEENFQLCSILTQGGDHLAYSMRGWYHHLLESNVPVDFVSVQHNADDLQNYKALILPFPLCLSETVAEKLRAYVEAGGCLISEAAPGRINEQAFCNRGEMSPILANLFGVRQTGFTMVREPNAGERWSPPERTWGEYLDATMLEGAGPLAGEKLRANVYVQTFDCQAGAEPVLKAGDAVAGVRRTVGDGQAWLLGTYIGHNGTAYRDPAIHAAVRALLTACGLSPEHKGKLIVRKRVTPDKEAWIFTNPTGETVTETIALPNGSQVSDLLGGPLPVSEGPVEVTVAPLDVRVMIVEG